MEGRAMEKSINREDYGLAKTLFELVTRLRVGIQTFLSCCSAAIYEARRKGKEDLARRAFRQ
jgi:hypothetical protein